TKMYELNNGTSTRFLRSLHWRITFCVGRNTSNPPFSRRSLTFFSCRLLVSKTYDCLVLIDHSLLWGKGGKRGAMLQIALRGPRSTDHGPRTTVHLQSTVYWSTVRVRCWHLPLTNKPWTIGGLRTADCGLLTVNGDRPPTDDRRSLF